MKRQIAIIGLISLIIVSGVSGIYLWRQSNPRFSYNLVRIPINELQDDEWFDCMLLLEREFFFLQKGKLIFSQRLETYEGAKAFFKLQIDIQGNVITIIETYDSEEAINRICPYDLYGRIEPLQKGIYTIIVIFINKYTDKTETLYEMTVNTTVVSD